MTSEHGYWVMKIMFYTNQKHLDESEHVPITNFHHLDRFYTLSDFLDAPCSSELFRSSRLGVSIYTLYMTLEHEYWVMKLIFYTNRNHLDESEYVQRTHFAHINRFLTLSDFLEAPYTSLSVSPACMVCLSALVCLFVWYSYLSCVSCLSVCYACCLECVCLLLSVFFVCLPGVSVWSFLFLPHGKHKRSLCSLIFRLGKDEIETTNNY